MQPDISKEDLDIVNKILTSRTLCEVFGVDASVLKEPNRDKLLKKAYFKLSLKVHPDKNHAPRSVEAFQLLGTSFARISQLDYDQPLNSRVPQQVEPKKYQSEKQSDLATRIFEEMMKKNQKQSQPEFTSAQEKLYSKLKKTCKAKTKEGTDCMKPAVEGTLYCHVHHNYDPGKPKPEKIVKEKCQANTKEGSRCSKSVFEGGKYCMFHLNYDPNVKKPEPPVKVKCAGIKKDGSKCSKSAQPGQKFCNMHSKQSS